MYTHVPVLSFQKLFIPALSDQIMSYLIRLLYPNISDRTTRFIVAIFQKKKKIVLTE